MAHALAAFIRQQMDERGLRNRDVVRDSGLSRAQVSRYVTDGRDVLPRLPERETLAALAKAFNVPVDFLFAKAVESLGLGYTSGDFVNSVSSATDRELLDAIEGRLRERAAAVQVAPVLPLITPSAEAGPYEPLAARPGGATSDEEQIAVAAALEAEQLREEAERAARDAETPPEGESSPAEGEIP